jgi:hypothetical protein
MTANCHALQQMQLGDAPDLVSCHALRPLSLSDAAGKQQLAFQAGACQVLSGGALTCQGSDGSVCRFQKTAGSWECLPGGARASADASAGWKPAGSSGLMLWACDGQDAEARLMLSDVGGGYPQGVLGQVAVCLQGAEASCAAASSVALACGR